MRKETGGLYYKFNMLIIGGIFLCGLLIGGMLLQTARMSLESGLDRAGQEVAASLAATISNDILVDDRFAIHERISRVMETNDQIRYIIVTHPDGAILASSFIDGLPKGLPTKRLPADNQREEDVQIFSSNEGTVREVIMPIDSGINGYIRVGTTEKQLVADLREKSLLAILFVVMVCVVASILATRYAHEFLKPIARLSYAVKQMDKGKYGVQVAVTSHDEIGQLARTFNKMSAGLQSTIEENNQLVEDLKEKEESRVWLIQQLFSAREDEKRKISRELHDESSQSVATILTYLRLLHDKLDTDEQREMLFEIRELTAMTLEGIRQMAVDLHPPLLEDLGLVAAIEKYLEPIKKMHPDIDIQWSFEGDFTQLSRPVALMCYRTLQEGVANVLKHAEANSIKIFMRLETYQVTLIVEDDGIGFDHKTAEKARLNRHLGLVSMRERTELLKGSFSLVSTPGKGTKITMTLPIFTDGGTEVKNE